MKIYIARHGIAEEQARQGGDSMRELTEEGRKKMKEEAAGFARLEPEIQAIFASPLVRARQTAELLAAPLQIQVQEMKELAPGYGPAQVSERLQEMKKNRSVILVGHEPNCSDLALYLCGGNLEFKKGAICLIESEKVAEGTGFLIWHLGPAVLRLMK